jgi:hypothetical protein
MWRVVIIIVENGGTRPMGITFDADAACIAKQRRAANPVWAKHACRAIGVTYRSADSQVAEDRLLLAG